jgi:uncharacterized membrane-anchored protein
VSDARLDAITRTAVAEGLLPDSALLPGETPRPWPVVLMSALGAWLVGVPMFGLITQLFLGVFDGNLGPYVIGALVLAAAVGALRRPSHTLFVEQLAVAGLVAGASYLAIGLTRQLPTSAASALLATLALLLAVLLRQNWLRMLLGAAACTGALVAGLDLILPHAALRSTPRVALWVHLLLAVWLLAPPVLNALVAQRSAPPGALSRSLAWLDAVGTGWLAVTLLALGALAGSDEWMRGSPARTVQGFGWADLMAQLSVLAALAAAVVGWRCWPPLRAPWWLGVAAALTVLAWFMPTLGAVLLALSACATTHRWRLASLAVLTGLWIASAFYYQLTWTLAQKAALLAASGLWLGLLAAWGQRRSPQADHAAAAPAATSPSPSPPSRWARAGSIACVLATLAVANTGIWRNEALIRDGQPVFVELAPVDPRSLMQGDYMALDYRMHAGLQSQLAGLSRLARQRVVARIDARGVAELLRLADDKPVAADERLIELVPRSGRWVLVSDAWFFREGQGALWQAARYGEFRLAGDGRALLVGLADAGLQPIRTPVETLTTAGR